MRPLIGIPKPTLDPRYASAVEATGGSPVWLRREEDADRAVAPLAALLLPGGGDFPPERSYPPGVDFDLVAPEQLEFDRRVLGCALARGIPVLGICYGMQLIALHHGGSLHYDLATDLPHAGPHRLREPEGRHRIRLEAATRLARLFPGTAAEVNSRHHQAVAEPGAGLRVAARAPDGVIEAIESTGEGFCLGVQWQPERMDAEHRERLFGALVRACAPA